jgi:hypothetical protein
MQHDDWLAIHGHPAVNQAATRMAARTRPRPLAPAANLFIPSLLMGMLGVALAPGIQGLIPVPRRGKPVRWVLDEVEGNAGSVSLQLEYAPYASPNRTYTVFSGTEAPNLNGQSANRGPATTGVLLQDLGWPPFFETDSVIRVTAVAPAGVEWLLLWIVCDQVPQPIGVPTATDPP